MLRLTSLVEQFLITKPSDSWKAFEEMAANSAEFLKSLGLPFQTVAIRANDLNLAAAKKYDLEAWYPHQHEYKELCSVSNW
jgi:seryl-tRNA synthetase